MWVRVFLALDFKDNTAELKKSLIVGSSKCFQWDRHCLKEQRPDDATLWSRRARLITMTSQISSDLLLLSNEFDPT